MNRNKEIKILLIDDHPMILEGYMNVLSTLELKKIKISIETANNCDLAWSKIISENHDIVLMDINFPILENTKIMSGEDLGLKVRQKFPNIKIIILTFLEDQLRLNNILKKINPDGFMLKGETNSNELVQCFESIITHNNYYSAKITEIQHSSIFPKFSLDEKDRLILFQLSLGTKTKELTTYVNLSLRAIEDRKRKLKELFKVSGKGNRALLEKARECGFI